MRRCLIPNALFFTEDGKKSSRPLSFRAMREQKAEHERLERERQEKEKSLKGSRYRGASSEEERDLPVLWQRLTLQSYPTTL